MKNTQEKNEYIQNISATACKFHNYKYIGKFPILIVHITSLIEFVA